MKVNLEEHDCQTGKCKKYKTDNKYIVVSKKGKKYELINDTNGLIETFDLDDCIFENTHNPKFKLCDYVIKIKPNPINTKSVIYVWTELKGSDLNQACYQILDSYKNAIDYNSEVTHYARVVLSRNNKADIRNDGYKNMIQIFKQRFDYSNKVYNKDRSSELYLKNKK